MHEGKDLRWKGPVHVLPGGACDRGAHVHVTVGHALDALEAPVLPDPAAAQRPPRGPGKHASAEVQW